MPGMTFDDLKAPMVVRPWLPVLVVPDEALAMIDSEF